MMKKILVVDDDPGVRYTVKSGLETVDDTYKVISIDSGFECLKYLKNNDTPDIILLDVMMPGMSGWETFDKIRDNTEWKKIPIVFLTARTDEIAKNAGNLGVGDLAEGGAGRLTLYTEQAIKDLGEKLK